MGCRQVRRGIDHSLIRYLCFSADGSRLLVSSDKRSSGTVHMFSLAEEDSMRNKHSKLVDSPPDPDVVLCWLHSLCLALRHMVCPVSRSSGYSLVYNDFWFELIFVNHLKPNILPGCVCVTPGCLGFERCFRASSAQNGERISNIVLRIRSGQTGRTDFCTY